MYLQFIPNSCFSGGEDGLTLHVNLQMWGNCGKNKKRKIAKPLVFKGLAIVYRVELVPKSGT